ncbi:MAG: hypothetical protein ABJB34_11690, partial [Acidobacteriota bacterium]
MRIQQRRRSGLKMRVMVLMAIAVSILFAFNRPVQAKRAGPVYSKTDAMVVMRDGVHLYTKIFTPNITDEKL